MGDHLVLHVENLVKREVSEQSVDKSSSGAGALVPRGAITSDKRMEEHEGPEEEEPLIQTMECRICQEEDHIEKLESPCACSGSLKFAHRKCVQRWCNEKGNVICEICHQPYQPGYTAPIPSPSPPPRPGETTVDISEGWTFPGGPMDAHDPRLLAIAAAERHFLEADYDEYTSTDTNGAAFLRSAALILMALLLLRHALTMTGADSDDDDASTIFSLFLLRAVGFLLPCYIMAWAVSILQQRRQSEDATALAAAEVAFVLQSGQPGGGLQFTIAPAPVRTTIHQSPGLINDTPRNG